MTKNKKLNEDMNCNNFDGAICKNILSKNYGNNCEFCEFMEVSKWD